MCEKKINEKKVKKSGVYFVKEEKRDEKEHNRIKVGKSKNIDARIGTLQVGNSDELKLVDYFETNNLSQVENAVHKYMEDNNIRGEWFELNDDELNNCFTFVKEYISKSNSTENDQNTSPVRDPTTHKFTCTSCNYSTNKRIDFTRHLQAKRHLSKMSPESILKTQVASPSDIKPHFECHFCHTKFTRLCNLTRHKKSCIEAKYANIQSKSMYEKICMETKHTNIQNDSMLEKVKELEAANKKLSNVVDTLMLAFTMEFKK